MTGKLVRTVFFALLAASHAALAQFDAARFESLVEEGMRDWRVPGLALAVVDDGEIVYENGWGVTVPGGAPVDERTLFANASTTKAMVAAGLLVLADEERLDLDDPVIDYLPELHFGPGIDSRAVTIRDLLAHRTGLARTDFWTFAQRMPLDEQIERLRLVAPAAGPRERLLYQNTMYELAGLVIDRVAGKPWYEFLDERLWTPIGMHDTVGLRGHIPAGSARAFPHDEVDGRIVPIAYDLEPDREDAAGSAWSTAHDMALWARFLLAGGVTADGRRLLSEDAIADMFRPAQLASAEDFYPTVELTRPQWMSYALGWFQQDFDGRKIDFHTGSLDGLVAILGLDRAAGRAIVVLQNLDGSELRHALMWEFLDTREPAARRDWLADVRELYRERRREDEREWQEAAAGRLAGAGTTLPLDAYYGRYASELLGTIEFAAARGGDVVVPARPSHDGPVLRTSMYEYEAAHWHVDTFTVDYMSWSYPQFARFLIDPAGAVEAIEVFGEVFERVE